MRLALCAIAITAPACRGTEGCAVGAGGELGVPEPKVNERDAQRAGAFPGDVAVAATSGLIAALPRCRLRSLSHPLGTNVPHGGTHDRIEEDFG